MKFAMYTSALAITVALAGCSSSSNNPVGTPGTPDSDPAPNKITYDNNADQRTMDRTRAELQFAQPTEKQQGKLDGFQGTLEKRNDQLANAQILRAELASLDFEDPNDWPDLARILDEYKDKTGRKKPGEQGNDTQEEMLAQMDKDINSHIPDKIATAEKDLQNEYVKQNRTDGKNERFTENRIKLADGSVMNSNSFGYLRADNQGPFYSSNVVAAYEEDNLGRITRVAFVETNGIDYVQGPSIGDYKASGQSAFAVKVDDGFFDILAGESELNLNLTSESGNVTANANGDGKVAYQSNVVFNPTTGEFTASNGQLVYSVTDSLNNTTTLSANNAEILGKLHGDMTTDAGADYTGIVTVGNDRMEAVGTVIGQQTGGSVQK